MADLIDRAAALNCFHGWVDRYGDVHTADEMAEYRAIEELPTVEPQIIRCKDCEWFGDIGCAIEVIDDSDRPTKNDFCSFAERRTDE